MPEHPTLPPESSLTPAELSHEVASYIDTLKVQIHALCATYDIPITRSIQDTIQAFADKARAREIPPKALTHLLALFTAWSAAAETNRIPPELRASSGIPLEPWAPQLNATLNEQLQSGKSAELKAAFPGIEFDPDPVEFLIQYQEDFYRTAYHDPAFTIDRSRLTLTPERLADITAAMERGEVDYPLITASPRTLTPEELGTVSPHPAGGGARGGGIVPTPEVLPRTLHRVLFDRLIRGKRIKEWARTDPAVSTFLDQVRDLTLPDITRTDLLGPDGKPLTFPHNPALPDNDPNQPWLPYLQALYPTLPTPDPQDHLDPS